MKPLKYSLHHSFTDKNKYVKRNIAVELESLAASLDEFVDQSLKEFFMSIYDLQQKIVIKILPSSHLIV